MSRNTMVRGNVRYVEAMQGLRRSNAAGKHDPRPNRKRSRGDAKRAAIREYA